jgi:hypothetical protein
VTSPSADERRALPQIKAEHARVAETEAQDLVDGLTTALDEETPSG